MKTYYNTVPEPPEKVKELTAKAEKQEDIILLHFKIRGKLSPTRMMYIAFTQGHNWPLTSIRRAITNLERRGLLEKTGEKVKGSYGRNENVWRII